MQRAVFINLEAAHKAADEFVIEADRKGMTNCRVKVYPVYARGCQLVGWGVKYQMCLRSDYEWMMEV